MIPLRVCKQLECKSFHAVTFSLDDTIKYFAHLSLEQEVVEGLYQACGGGIPGHLATVRRNIMAGRDPMTLMKEKLTDLYEEEWDQVRDDESALDVLAVIAYAQHRATEKDVARLLKQEEEQVRATIARLAFLSVDDHTSEVSFVSESFCEFATARLQGRREFVIDQIINDLMARRESQVAVDHLPLYLEQRGRLNDVMDFLSPEYFERIIEHSQSLVPVRQKANLGITTAMSLQLDGELIRFGIQKSAITEFETAEVWRSEIEALMALNDYNGAMNLAQSMLLKEDRLHLLAVIARSRLEKGEPAETEVLQQIRTLYNQIDPMSLGDRAIDIATDLFCSCPDLAIDLLERTTWTEVGENALDLAYVKLSIDALGVFGKKNAPYDKIEAIRARIKDPKLRRFTATVSLLAGNQTAQEVITGVKKMEAAEDQLQLLRQWAVENRERPDSAEVVEYALDLAIRTAAYAPNARVLRELAMPLPFIEDETRAKRLLGTFDSQKDAVEHLGPTEDYVRLQLLLARTEKKFEIEACRNRLIEVFFYIHGLDDLAVRAACLARLLAALDKIDPKGDLETKDKIRSETASDLDQSIDDLLRATAEHYYVTRSIVKALAISRPEKALVLATNLNTQDRRERLSNTNQARTTLRQVFEATVLAAEIAARMATRFSNQIKRLKLIFDSY